MKKNIEACTDFKKALALGFTQEYGSEVEELVKKYCKEASDPVQKM